MKGFLRLSVLILLLAACAPRSTLVIVPGGVGIGTPYTVFVGSTRERDPTLKGLRYTERAPLGFLSYDVSVPPNRKPGEVRTARRRGADVSRDFVATAANRYASPASFRSAIQRGLRERPKAGGNVVVYVHGYNNTIADSVFRLAQLTHDLKIDDLPVSYTWPSAENPLAYAYDRDSALFARDGFESFLTEVSRSGADSITIVGHSMGSLVVMETLRQMAIRNDREVLPKLGGVVLMSPDLDVDLFRSQAKRIGTLPQPFLIFVSSRDKALRLSARLTGLPARLGNLADVKEVADLDVTLIDVSNFQGGGLDHFTAAENPALLKILGQVSEVDAAFGRDNSGRTGLVPGTILTVQSATSIILSPVTVLSGRN
ncbi:alpha/beta hydrolase [Vannielia litorea]|uniref:Esterase/lipase superfamily enzyme n=1 Tax=Vannielia litorea TaxID=1217970 RepID=A0A1N6HK75_9RHOB|nr:alpha/beta fold hydrolase [Vannielia litorea]SIO20133.1 Esterase/lipase superfamily enzyme [Vannielia litorea]